MTVHLPVLSSSGEVQPPPPPAPRISASQLDTFAQCMAKWGYQYLDGHRPPPHPSAQCGTRVHEILEGWLSKGIPPNIDEVLVIGDRVYEVGKIALAGLHNLPAPGPHHDVEGGFELPFMSGYPASWRGYIDSSYVVHDTSAQPQMLGPVLFTASDGSQVLGRVEIIPEILDHKTTTNLDYRKTPGDLLLDVQAMIYAWVGLTRVPTADRVNLRWVYYKTSKPYKSEVTYTTVTREHVMNTLRAWEELAIVGPLRAKALGLRGAQLPKNPRACGRYGGCPHKDVRCRLTREERIEASMSTQPDILSMIEQTKASLAAGAPPPPPPPIEGTIAPLLGQPPRAGGFVPPQPTTAAPWGAPPSAGGFVPPQPTTASPWAPQGGLAPAPAVQAPPPVPPGPPGLPGLPAPWVLTQNPAWAYNPTNGEYREVAQLAAPPSAAPPPAPFLAVAAPAPFLAVAAPAPFQPPQAAPPAPQPPQAAPQAPQPPQAAPQAPQPPQAAPQPPQAAPQPPHYPSVTTDWPEEARKNIIAGIRAGASDQQIAEHYPWALPTLPQLRKDLVTIDEYTARTTAPKEVRPLTPEETAGLRIAVQRGASDMQILAVYPHARPHLDALRLEIQGPQRATGINAPESAGTPQLAQPAAPSAQPASSEADPSKQGDAYDAMDTEALRLLAKQHGIDVKGLREKNLRITVRNELRAKGIAPGAPAPAQVPQVQMQPQQLPIIFGTPPAAPSIPQAVQAHLTQPGLPPAAPVATLVGPQAQAIREALDGLNKVGDALRKLIGAD